MLNPSIVSLSYWSWKYTFLANLISYWIKTICPCSFRKCAPPAWTLPRLSACVCKSSFPPKHGASRECTKFKKDKHSFFTMLDITVTGICSPKLRTEPSLVTECLETCLRFQGKTHKFTSSMRTMLLGRKSGFSGIRKVHTEQCQGCSSGHHQKNHNSYQTY